MTISPQNLRALVEIEREKRRRNPQPTAPACTWQPLPGPQTAAYESRAKWIGYGGAAGGGKTDLALGMAGTTHRRSLILRRLFPSLRGTIERSREVYNSANAVASRDAYNESLHRWKLSDGRYVGFGNVQYDAEWEKYRGNPHDLYVFDEATEFTERVVRAITAWNRTSVIGQTCQVLLTFNPPSDEAGRWVIVFFLPWMAYLYPDLPECKTFTGIPAQPGEVRWYASVDGVDTEVSYGTPKAEGRTFFPAKVEDNPIYMQQGYDATLEALPEPLRSQLRYGDFGAGVSDDPWQVIPTAWVELAQQRWTERPPEHVHLSGVGADIARGGNDQTTIAKRYRAWYAPLICVPGKDTPTGQSTAALIISTIGSDLTHEPTIGIDVIGIGASAFDQMGDVECIPINAGAAAPDGATDKSRQMSFLNTRAYLWWRMRESLDPKTGDAVALPPDPQLRAELCSPKWFLRSGRIQVESKDEIRKRIGRSTDRADAVIMANYPEQKVRLRWL